MDRILLASVIIISLNMFSCMNDFTSPDQAKNEINSKGVKDGRWVEYILSNENGYINEPNSQDDIVGYRLIEYKDGYIINNVKEYYYNGDRKEYKYSLPEPATLSNFPWGKYIDTIKYFSDNYSKLEYNGDSTYYIEHRFMDPVTADLVSKQIELRSYTVPDKIIELLDDINRDYLSEKTKNLLEGELDFHLINGYKILYNENGTKDTSYLGIPEYSIIYNSKSSLNESILSLLKDAKQESVQRKVAIEREQKNSKDLFSENWVLKLMLGGFKCEYIYENGRRCERPNYDDERTKYCEYHRQFNYLK